MQTDPQVLGLCQGCAKLHQVSCWHSPGTDLGWTDQHGVWSRGKEYLR